MRLLLLTIAVGYVIGDNYPPRGGNDLSGGGGGPMGAFGDFDMNTLSSLFSAPSDSGASGREHGGKDYPAMIKPIPSKPATIIKPYPKTTVDGYPKGGLGNSGQVSSSRGAGPSMGGGGMNEREKVGGHGYIPSIDSVLEEMQALTSMPPRYKKVANTSPISGACPFGWQMYEDMCYYFSRDKMNWYEASMKCEYMGGYLAVVNSAHENSYLKLMASKSTMSRGVWIGLNDCLFPKTHTWYWGYSTKQCEWFDWAGKEPNFNGPNHSCVVLSEKYKYLWALENCRSKQYYVCEMAPNNPCTCNAA